MQKNATPLPWYPHGCTDSLDATEAPDGSMASLSNLVPDPSTTKLWQPRPAAVKIGDATASIAGAGFISAFKIVGNFMYGMIASSLTAGFDQPFAFNLTTNAFITVTGITASNVPVSPATSGAWTPPIMDVVGSKVLVTHPGFGTTANFFGVFTISTPSAPAWSAGNLTGAITFSTVPSFVAQFNGRAYWIVNTVSQPAVVFSDPLNGTNVTNATQSLTFGDSVPLTALGQLRLWNQLGGIVQGLIVFKGVSNMFQITGDASTNNLLINSLAIATGTNAPLTIAATKSGLAFMSPDGVRIIDFQGNVSEPLGHDGEGITVPFIYSNVPSRMCMAASGDVLRVTTQNQQALNTPFQEWWYDEPRKAWHGPHTFPASLIGPYQDTFIMTPVGVNKTIWQSDPQISQISVFVENGVQLNWTYQTSFLPNTRQMVNNAMSFATLDIALSSSGPPVTATAIDPNNFAFDSVQVSISGAASVWGAFTWGVGLWGAPAGALQRRQLQWHLPIVFAKLALQVQGQSNAATKVGCLMLKYKQLKYLEDITAVA